MANRIQNAYRSHMQANSPDMDMLWAKIEQRIDAKTQAQTKTQTQPEQTVSQQSKITVRRSRFAAYITAAACLIAVVAGALIYIKAKDMKIKTDTNSGSYAEDAAASSGNESYEMAKIDYDDVSSAEPAKENDMTEEEKKDKDQKGVPGSDSHDSKREYKADINSTRDKINNNTAKTTESLSPPDKLKKVMDSDEYKNADQTTKEALVSKAANDLLKAKVITNFVIEHTQGKTFIELELPGGVMETLEIK